MRKLFLMLVAVVAIVLTGCKKKSELQPQESDDIIVYGDIYTAEIDSTKAPDSPEYYKMAKAMVIKDGKFLYVGSVEEADKLKTAKCRIIDRRNSDGIIIPGMTDGHAHYMLKYINKQMEDNTIQFAEDLKYEQVIAMVRDFVEKAKKEGRQLDYVYGEGYDPIKMEKDGKDQRHRKDLDAITTDIPIYLTGYDHHSTLVNTRCMINAGILYEDGREKRTQVAGGFMYRDDNNELNGVFAERAISLLQGPGLNNKMHPTAAQVSNGIGEMQDYLLSVGITNIIEGWANNYGADDVSLFQALKTLDVSNNLHLNVSLTYEIEPWYDNNYPFGHVQKAALVQQAYQSKHVHPDYIKLFMDGCSEMGTGFLTGTYNGGGVKDSIFSGHGTDLWSQEATDKIVKLANDANLSVHTHAMGDGAVHRCVLAYIASNNKKMRNSICHLRNVNAEDYALIKQNDIAVTSNMNWHCFTESDTKRFAETMPAPYDTKAYPMKSFFDNGILVSQCTDTPADNGINYPFYCMQVAITGAYEPSSYIWDKDEIINRYQFLQAATYNGAWELHLEKERGSIKEGKYADFVILDKNILTCDVQMLQNVQVLYTFFEGNEVYPKK
ncbi:MAG: amidohydrolase family protein [Paludibacteraceae bacterium]|nr:amidohydrolase family protein [Paludibacteraceae bacterium]